MPLAPASYAAALLAVILVVTCDAIPQPPFSLRIEHLPVERAIGVDVQEPRFSWLLQHTRRAEVQHAYQVFISGYKSSWSWDSGKVASSQIENVLLPGVALLPDNEYVWRVKWWDSKDTVSEWSSNATFTTGLFTKKDWDGAEWIGGNTTSGVQLRTTFTLPAAASVKQARIFVVGVGYFKCELNGQLISDHELGHFTTIDQRVLYDTFDVSSSSFALGAHNAIGCTLGDGPLSGGGHVQLWKSKALLLKLSVLLSDGTRTSIVSSASEGTHAQQWWDTDGTQTNAAQLRSTSTAHSAATGGDRWVWTQGPYTKCAIFGGVSYDSRRETPGWTTGG
jgi:alpha-L-rhamnosidase